MRLTLLCVGRLRDAPEQALTLDYIARARASGRALGLSEIALVEVEAPGGMAREGAALAAKIPDGAHVIVLDEHGRVPTSRGFAQMLAQLRDGGPRDVVLIIGGADGLATEIKSRAQDTLAFGAWTWPHRLVRVMLAEQIYRAVSIWGQTPYHRD